MGAGNTIGAAVAELCARVLAAMAFGLAAAATAQAAQTDIHGPSGSGFFGQAVTVLPNGNFVVTDPEYSTPTANFVGAAYLFGSGGALISALTGNQAGDLVGSDGVVVVGNGNFVVASSYWRNGAAAEAGAVTWVNGSTGLSGHPSRHNSLVGTTQGDQVGAVVTALRNGNYVVISYHWRNGSALDAGAVTWASGSTGFAGTVSASNSLVGSQANDYVGFSGITELRNGNYVVSSRGWNNGTAISAGAVTWANGTLPLSGVVSASNSLVGTTQYDAAGFGGIVALANGNYVVASPEWNTNTARRVGAVTWANGATGLAGPISPENSLVGSATNDAVGTQVVFPAVTALSNGNYVVSSFVRNGPISVLGSVTWADGRAGLSGPVTAGNSLIGTGVGSAVLALTNGNYVVLSSGWGDGVLYRAGAATWLRGDRSATGIVTASNSLVGDSSADEVGYYAVALSNGDYLVGSPWWREGPNAPYPPYGQGAVTLGSGSGGSIGPVTANNSIIGKAFDQVGDSGITVLSNGNYVIGSHFWSDGTTGVGAATWIDAASRLPAGVSTENSLVGSTELDQVGFAVYALTSGHYVVDSLFWNNGGATQAGAVTWGDARHGIAGPVSARNSLVGTTTGDLVGSGGIFPQSDGSYVVFSPLWNNGSISGAGAISLGSGTFRMAGSIQPYNSVRGETVDGGQYLQFAYDSMRKRLVVGRPADNVVSLFTMEQIFFDAFE